MKQEVFYSLKEAQSVIGLWQNTYNRVRPRSSLGLRPPAPVTLTDLAFCLPMAAAMRSALTWPGPKFRSDDTAAFERCSHCEVAAASYTIVAMPWR